MIVYKKAVNRTVSFENELVSLNGRIAYARNQSVIPAPPVAALKPVASSDPMFPRGPVNTDQQALNINKSTERKFSFFLYIV